MTARFKTACLAGFALAGLGFIGSASAMPTQGLQNALATSSDGVKLQDVRLICPPYRPCYRVPGYYGGYGRPYGYYRPYGYRPYYRHRFFY